MVNDPIADLLTRIRNSILRSKKQISVPSSKMIVAIVEILKTEGFVTDFKVAEEANNSMIDIELEYDSQGKPAIHKIERVSKPGLRVYRGYRDIPVVLRNLGISIFSTPKGIMTGTQAKREKVGGEYLCKIW